MSELRFDKLKALQDEVERLKDSKRNLEARLLHIHIFNDEANKQRLELDALKKAIDEAPQLYMPKEHLEYTKTKRFPSIDFFATCPPDGKREYIAVALVIKKENK